MYFVDCCRKFVAGEKILVVTIVGRGETVQQQTSGGCAEVTVNRGALGDN